MLSKSYDPQEAEKRWYKFWNEKGYFHANPQDKGQPFSIVIPPPNVTGSLHMGHALNITLQDILIRWKKMSGFNALWVPGTDHAGIATQNVVEKQIATEGLNRHQLGRDSFIERVWQWKEEHGGRIIYQLKEMGAACDWSKIRFTLDEGLSMAVREVFVRLYEEGLIYRGDYIINWCPRCHTALSDLEVEHEERKEKIYSIKYPFADDEGYIVVATTRPETMLGDTAVAVHPEDSRYVSYIGKHVQLPLINRIIPIIADEFVDPQFGTGAVKVTPAHDPNDFDIAGRHQLKAVTVINPDGTMSDQAGSYTGQDRFTCRKNLLRDLEAEELLVEVQDHNLAIGTCYRCKTIVEPYLSKQWFVKVKPLAEEAIQAVKEKKIRIIPENWENNYFDWMNNIKDWCISRQIWWGHRIPAWYCEECSQVVVSAYTPVQCPKCNGHRLKQDEDVLDTWFSSALWPFSTLGWPDATKELEVYYPTSVLVTGFDILFFWVARMIMMGMKFMKAPPFKDVYIHALVRDFQGQKMSKSKGNVVDPLEMTEKFGTDAFRFTLTAFAAQGRDIKFSENRVEGYRHFMNKIWNAARFIVMNLEDVEVQPFSKGKWNLSLAERWILSRLTSVTRQVNQSLEEYHFNDAASALYQFIWHEFCDWFLEMVKPALYGSNGTSKDSILSTLVYSLETLLRLLHPFMPFITEELWQNIPHEGESIYKRPYPDGSEDLTDKEAEYQINYIMEAVNGVRSIRGELNLSPSRQFNILIKPLGDRVQQVLLDNMVYLSKLANVDNAMIDNAFTKPKGSAFIAAQGMEIYVPLEGVVDIESEIARLLKVSLKKEETFLVINRKLSNSEFTSKAPKEVVEKEKIKANELYEEIEKLKENIQRMQQWQA
jgi:valyl-tRNA synthetase